MGRRTQLIFLACIVLLLPVVILVPLSRAQVTRITTGALLKSVLPLNPGVPGDSRRPPSALPAGKEPAPGNGVIVGASYHNDTSPPLRDIKQLPIGRPAGEEANENPRIPKHHRDGPDEATPAQPVASPS